MHTEMRVSLLIKEKAHRSTNTYSSVLWNSLHIQGNRDTKKPARVQEPPPLFSQGGFATINVEVVYHK